MCTCSCIALSARRSCFAPMPPWEGNASAYQSLFQDGNIYRMYYRGSHFGQNPTDSGPLAKPLKPHSSYLCYAESLDGIHWRRPELGLYRFPRQGSNGSRANNIVLHPDTPGLNVGPSGAAVFFDDNPDCPSDERYKIIGVGDRAGRGLYVMKSADGIRFSPLSDKPIVTEGAFDSQNIVFWDPTIKAYREYHRIHLPGGVPGIATSTSKEILGFPSPKEVNFPGTGLEGLYTPVVKPYYRAPHILVGFPTRYTEHKWSGPLLALPGLEERLARANSYPPSRPPLRFGRVITDALFMTSRDGANFKRWPEAFIRPGPRQRESWVYGDNFVFWGMVETRSHLEDAPDEISLYATEGYWEGTDTAVRRYTVRIDGFVSAAASAAGGEFVTKPLLFEGGNLTINFETSGASGVRVEIQEADGTPHRGLYPGRFSRDVRRLDPVQGTLEPRGRRSASEGKTGSTPVRHARRRFVLVPVRSLPTRSDPSPACRALQRGRLVPGSRPREGTEVRLLSVSQTHSA